MNTIKTLLSNFIKKIKREIKFRKDQQILRKRLKELQKRDPFIY
jgi:hypothetical protein